VFICAEHRCVIDADSHLCLVINQAIKIVCVWSDCKVLKCSNPADSVQKENSGIIQRFAD